MASSTSPPGTAGPSATSSGRMAFSRGGSWATAGAAINAMRKVSQRSIGEPLAALLPLVEVGPQPTRRDVNIESAPPGIVLQLVLADPRHAEIAGIPVGK